MTTAFCKLSRSIRLAAFAGCLASALVGTAAAAPSQRQASERQLSVIGYSSEQGLQHAVALSGGRIVRRIPALHVAVVRAPVAALQVLDHVRQIRYSQRPVPRYELIDPGVVAAPVPGGAYEWQYAATRETLVAPSVAQAASAVTVAVIDTGADVTAPDLAAKAPTTWSVLDGSTDEIFAAACEQGMTTLRQDGIRLCLAGTSSLDEIRRVTGERLI